MGERKTEWHHQFVCVLQHKTPILFALVVELIIHVVVVFMTGAM